MFTAVRNSRLELADGLSARLAYFRQFRRSKNHKANDQDQKYFRKTKVSHSSGSFITKNRDINVPLI